MAVYFNLMCPYALSPAPPLTVENILKALEGVKDWEEVANWLRGTYGSSSLRGAVEQFLQGQGLFQPSWRAVIFALDEARETRTPLASRIMSYGEPVQGRYTYTHQAKIHTLTPYHGMCTITVV